MPTPSIQTLVTDAQQILNLDSISAVRSVVAVALANANTGTPLNPNLTTQQLWNEFYQVVNKPKSDIESIIANQLMKLLYAPPAPGGVGADQQVIFNDGGVLAGDADFKWNKTTNLLTILGSASISNDLAAGGNSTLGGASKSTNTNLNFSSDLGTQRIYLDRGTRSLVFLDATSSIENYRIAGITGVHTWGVGGATAMTLNSLGLGVGVVPNANWTSYKLLQIGNGSFTNYSPTQDTGINSNIYYAGGQWYRISAAYACRYVQDGSGGIHAWFTAGTDAAGTIAALGSPKMTLTNPGDLNLAVGNIALGTSGKGIDFSATPSGSGTMTSELFADYEEGTFSPTVGAASGTPVSTTVNSAVYTKIGRIVVVQIDITVVDKGTASSSLIFSLPFNQTTAINTGSFRETSVTGNMGVLGRNSSADAYAAFYNNGTPWVNGYRIAGTYTYHV